MTTYPKLEDAVTGQAFDFALQESGQFVDDAQDFVQESSRQPKDWDQFRNPRLIDRYIEGKSHILLHFRKPKGAEYIACLHWNDGRRRDSAGKLESGVGMGADERLSAVERLFLAWLHCASYRYGSDSRHELVLVNNVELVQLPCPVAPSVLVWLDSFDSFKAMLPKSLYSGAKNAFEVFGEIADWERSVFIERTPSLGDQSPCQVVKSGTQIVDGVPQHKSYFVWDEWNCSDVEGYLISLRIVLEPDGVRVTAPKFIDGGFELVDVMLGPLVFC